MEAKGPVRERLQVAAPARERGEVTEDEIREALMDPGPPYVEGTCYPLRRYMLLHVPHPDIFKNIPNPFRRTAAQDDK